MINIRYWVIRHSRFFERIYTLFEKFLLSLYPILTYIRFDRLERLFVISEKIIKGFLFDTQMCGTCTLSSTGMSCPMNCPKKIRNGPCGGVRIDGKCEIESDMPCVWVKAHEGSQNMAHGQKINIIQPPVDHRLQGKSSWLNEIKKKMGNGA